MSFEFNCRTRDNVELVLEGSIFWELVDLKAMVKMTGNILYDTNYNINITDHLYKRY